MQSQDPFITNCLNQAHLIMSPQRTAHLFNGSSFRRIPKLVLLINCLQTVLLYKRFELKAFVRAWRS